MARIFFPTLLFCLYSMVTLAQSPEGKTTEGVWHTKIGDVDFYCLQDAPSEFKQNALITDDKELLQRLMPDGKAPGSYNVFVVCKGSETILIDTGKGGDMLNRLQTLDIEPEDIKTILLTHSHSDHVGGLVKDGKKAFPNARLYLTTQELKFWKSSRNKELCQQILKLYGEPEFLIPDEKTKVILPEMVAVDLAGHTPGQVGFLLSSGDQKLIVVADLLHCGAVQFQRPDISCRYDNDPELSAEIRRKTMKRAAEEKWLFVGSHLPFPSAGIVEVDGNAFRFVPAKP